MARSPMSTTAFFGRNNLWTRILICALMSSLVGLVSWVARDSTAAEFHNVKSRLLARKGAPVEELVLLTIDDDSVVNIGYAWPWDRTIYGDVAKFCGQSKVMGFDILFDLRHRDVLGGDANPKFGELISEYERGGGRAVLGLMLKEGTPVLRYQHDPGSRFTLSGIPPEMIPGAVSYEISMQPYPELLQHVGFLGHTALPEGRYGRYSVVADMRGEVMPSLALAMVMAHDGMGLADVRIDRPGGTLVAGRRRMDVDREGNIAYRHYQRPYPYFSFSDVYQTFLQRIHSEGDPCATPGAALGLEAGGRVAFAGFDNFSPQRLWVPTPETFKDRIVLVGSTATGVLGDREPSPISVSTPGILIHAAAIDNLLRGRAIWDWSWRWDLLVIFLLGMLPAWGDTPWRLVTGGLITWLCFLGATIVLIVTLQWFLPWLWPSIAHIASTVVLASMSWAVERVRRRELEDMEHAKQQFTDMLVHDLKGRVSSMVMSMSLMESEAAPGSRSRTLVDTMKSGGSRLLTQVNALLDIRKIEEGRMQLERTPVNIHDVIREIVKDYQSNAALIKLELVTEFDPGMERAVELDPDIFRRIMENLIWNALQYAKKRTVVQVETVAEADHCVVRVCNHGRIIPESTVKTLFMPFVSVRGDKNVKSVSTGLGLAFCRLATEAHSGSISLHSPWPGHEDGVQVVMSLPYTRRDET